MSTLTDPWIARGTLVEARLTGNTSIAVTSTAYVDVTGTVAVNGGTPGAGTLQVTATLLAGRRYWAEFFGMPFSSAAGDNAQIEIADGSGTQIGYAPRVRLDTAGFGYASSIAVPLYSTLVQSVTYKVRMLRVAGGSGTVDMAGGSLLRLRDDGLAP